MSKLMVLELFSGIGACSKALTNIDIDHDIVDAVEIDKYAIRSFNAIHGTNFEPQDITKWNKDIKCDLIMHGSPCQDFSIAGKQAGGDEGSGTRSSLMYETLRIVEKVKPKYVIWENVENILSKNHIGNWVKYCCRMNDLGYLNWGQVMNAKCCGVPQNRKRVFTVSIRRDISEDEFKFPAPTKLTKRLKDILEDKVDDKYYLTNNQLKNVDVKQIILDNKNSKSSEKSIRLGGIYDVSTKHQAGSIYSPKGVAATLDTMSGGNREPIIVDGDRIRKLTPRECWRLMGFSDEDFDKAAKVNSNSQLYKQAGNSIVVPVLESILGELLG